MNMYILGMYTSCVLVHVWMCTHVYNACVPVGG